MKSSPRATPWSGHVALLVVQLCFGLFPVLGKWADAAFTPRAIVAWRLVVAGGVFAVLAVAFHGRKVLLPWRILVRIQICAWLGIVLNQLFFLEGLRLSNSTHAGLLMACIPVVTLAIALLARQEAFSWQRSIGIGVAFFGAASLFWIEGLDFGSDIVRGDALMLCNVLLYSVYLVAMKPVMASVPSLIVVAWAFLLSAWSVPFFASGEVWFPEEASTEAWLSLLAILLFPTLLAYLLNLFALARVGASTVACYIFLQPIIAATAGAVFLHERFGWPTWAAATAIFTGLTLVLRSATLAARRARLQARA